MENFPSHLLENAVNELSKLPGIGKKTALRLALYLLRQKVSDVETFGNALIKLANEIKYCKICHNISDTDVCEICSSVKRDKSIVCVVEDVRDVMAIENTGQFYGVYHVLGGIISPIDGIGPDDLNIGSLINRVSEGSIKEVIMAFSTTVEGDTTNFFLYRKLISFSISITMIARGISIGDDIEYTDQLTLGRSIIHRLPYESLTSNAIRK